MKDPLEGQPYGFLAVVRLRGHLVDGLTQQVREVKDLDNNYYSG